MKIFLIINFFIKKNILIFVEKLNSCDNVAFAAGLYKEDSDDLCPSGDVGRTNARLALCTITTVEIIQVKTYTTLEIENLEVVSSN